MIASIRKSLNGLKKDREHGSGWLTLQALEILKAASAESSSATSEKFLSAINQVIDALVEARPVMVSIANYAMHFKGELESASATSKSPQRLRRAAFSIATKLIKVNEKSAASAARNAAKLITKRTIVMTCSYSSAACSALELARRGGIDFKVLAVESHHNKISYGAITAQRLGQSGISCRTVPDSQLRWHTARADIILLGADTISLHGWLINGTPSLELAQVAKRKGRPLYAVCETAKFDVRGFLAGLRQAEPGFDILPLDLITGLVTERGTLQPDDVFKFSIEDLFGSTGDRPH